MFDSNKMKVLRVFVGLLCFGNVFRAAGFFSGDEKKAEDIIAYLQNGGDPNRKNGNGDTFLHFASITKNIALVERLLAFGADPNISNRFGQTPLFGQINMFDFGNNDVLELLLKAGAQVGAKDYQNRNCLNLLDSIRIDSRVTISCESVLAKKRILQFYFLLVQTPKAVEERKTLFGQTVMHAYDKYFYDNDPSLLAAMLGIDRTASISSSVVKRAKEMFDWTGQHMDRQLTADYRTCLTKRMFADQNIQ